MRGERPCARPGNMAAGPSDVLAFRLSQLSIREFRLGPGRRCAEDGLPFLESPGGAGAPWVVAVVVRPDDLVEERFAAAGAESAKPQAGCRSRASGAF
jgi:hypothetical protein